MITVFYDGKCGLCSKEINHYRLIAPAGIFDWQDITQSHDKLTASGVSLVDALRRIHVRNVDGQLLIGVDAFILLWKQLARWRWLALLVSLPIIKQCARVVYDQFANWRFNRLEHCQLADRSGNAHE